MVEQAKKIHELGYSVIPVGDNKQPFGIWKESHSRLVVPDDRFLHHRVKGVGIVCGKVSGDLEVIDIDIKYDLTGTLFEDYKKRINSLDKDLLKLLVVVRTPSGGYHFLYRCSKLDRNLKLASRYPSKEELEENPQTKNRVLIETRGEGGYIQCYPTKGYEIVYGDYTKVQYISVEQRDVLMDSARSFNQCFSNKSESPSQKKVIKENVSPFEDWNQRGDVVALLEESGWQSKRISGQNLAMLRPAGKGMKSADWSEEKRLFYVFSSSTEFQPDHAYNPSQVLAKIKFNDDYSEAAKWLLKNGYGHYTPEQKNNIGISQKIEPLKVSLDNDDYSFLASADETDTYIHQKKNGTFKVGDKTGLPSLDVYWRFKEAEFDMVLGHDNVGKSVVTWWLAVLDCYFNNKIYAIFSGENKTGAVKAKLMEFYLCKQIENMNTLEFASAKAWVEKHFLLIKNDEAWTYKDIINMGWKLRNKYLINRFIVEPYNVLDKQATNEHQYDYKAMLDIRMFIKQSGVGVTLNVHAATEALRKVYPKQHRYEGYVMPPNKADAEGGGKFPNKADNFIVIHRMTDHPSEWMWTEIHVKKIKELETGGRITIKDEPYKVRMVKGGIGFEDEHGYNPMMSNRKDNYQVSLPIEPPSVMQPNNAFEHKYTDEELSIIPEINPNNLSEDAPF